ncbi:hypothetical protein ACWGKS_27105 [Nocardiopsis sp. NPDC055879]
MALPNESRRAPGRGRRPEDAPRLTAVPTSDPEPTPAPAGLPEALACAVLDPQTPPKTKPKAPEPPASEPEAPSAPQTPAPAPEQDQGAQAAAAASAELVEVESRSAAEAERAIRWLGVTYRPPDVWRERQPSLREEWEFVMDGSHLPEQGVWRAAARGYAAPTIALIGALHLAVWILRSPARHATAWLVLALPVVTAAFML